jgi:uncharacterized protein (UPF0248 family)
MRIKLNSTDKQYLAALLVLAGIVLFWRGIWDVMSIIPILGNPFVSLFLGLLIITLTGVVFQQFDPLGTQIAKTMEILNEIVSRRHRKEHYEIFYFDEKKNDLRKILHKDIKRLEHNFLVVEERDKEIFIPIHRVRKIVENGRTIWKK